MAWETNWTKANYPVDDKLVNQIGELLEDLIETNGGEWVGKIGEDILPLLGKGKDWYGTVWDAIRKAMEKFNIGYNKIGRNGGRYYKLSNENSNQITVDCNYRLQLKQIQLLLSSVDVNNISDMQSENLINIIDKILI